MKQFAIALLPLLLVIPALTCAQQADEQSAEPDIDTTLLHDVEEGRGQAVAHTDRWIGVLCSPVNPVLRSHLDLPAGAGLVIEEVVPDSPAERAGLQPHDILTQVDGEDLDSVHRLIGKIADSRDEGLTLTWIRKGREESAVIQAEKRPAGVATFRAGGEDVAKPNLGRLREWVEKLESGENGGFEEPFEFRFFGPGVPMRQFRLDESIPNNLSIRIERQDDMPARITVRKDDTTWEVTEDDIDSLPDEVRDTVKRMLQGDAGVRVLPFKIPEGPDMNRIPWPRFDERLEEMNERMEKMFDELRELRRDEQDEDDDSIDA